MPGDTRYDAGELGRQSLRQVLVSRYDALRAKLAKRLGSADLASDALHDTWLRLERAGPVEPVRDPFGYLIRTASNLASDRDTLQRRRARILETQGEDIVPQSPADPEQIAAAQSDTAAVRNAIEALPARRQAIFLAAWVEEIPYSEIALRHGVSLRTIQSEVKQAIAHCAIELQTK